MRSLGVTANRLHRSVAPGNAMFSWIVIGGLTALMMVVLTGCFAPAEFGATADPRGGSPDALSLAANATRPDLFRLETCAAIGTSTYWPSGTNPAQVPPEWQPPIDPFTQIRVIGFACDNMSWGETSRPLIVVFELHDRFRAPPECTEGRKGPMMMLNQMLVNDPEIALQLHESFGLPARHAEISFWPAQGLVGLDSWQWNVTGEEASSLSIHTTTEGRFESSTTDRWFWIDGARANFGDVHYEYETTNDESRVTTGEMAAPMLYHEAGFKDYAAYGATLRNAFFEVKGTRFLDLQCWEPAEAGPQ